MSSKPELSAEIVEHYLDSHYEFAKNYFERKATSSMIDHWMANRSHRPGSRSALHVSHVNKESLPEKVLKPPARVNSVSDLHADDRLKNLLGETPRKKAKLSKSELLKLDERQLFMELIRDIANELDINELSHKILVNVSILTNADRCSLFLVRGSKEHKVLVSKLFDVTSDSTVEDSVRSEEDEILVPFGVGIAGHTAQTGETINIPDAYSDSRFNPEVDKSTGYRTHSILCMPIKSHEGEVIGVAQIINKISGKHQFTQKDEEVFMNYLTFCGIGITNAQLFEISVQEYKRNQVLLQLARGIFEEQTNLDNCVYKIMLEAQELIACERCMVFLIDEAIQDEVVFSKAFDLVAGNEEGSPSKSSSTTHWSLNTGISAIVASTGQALNIPDAYADPRFNQEADQESGFTTKTILCMPIFNRQQKIVGVAQLLNKLNNKPFTDADESLFEAFAIFCGLGIHNTMMYEEACKLLAKQTVAMEVLSYHATAQQSEVDRIMKIYSRKELSINTPPLAKYNIREFEFDDFEMTDIETIMASLVMFMELDILNIFHVPTEVMARWLLSVKKNYRPVIYHNWRHAFNVAQTMFAMLTTGKMDVHFSDLEMYSLLVACLCHDLDHRGTNNAFQSKIDSPLATLYGTSTMEHHHFDHCIMILNSEGNNIFSELSPDDYRSAINVLEHAILSTDLAIYFKKKDDFESVCHSEEIDFRNDENRNTLRAMMMTACDVSAICKPWDVQQRVANLVASEFFEQGDIEREQLHEDPIPMMDRKKKDELPKMQVGFIDFICMPIYKLFAEIQPQLNPLYKGCCDNRQNWQSLHDERQAAKGKEGNENKEKTSNGRKAQKTDQGTREKTVPNVDKASVETRQPQKGVKKKTKNSKFCSII